MFLYTGQGYLSYSCINGFYRLVLNTRDDLAEYYRKLIPIAYRPMSNLNPSHISVIRKETPTTSHWGKHQGRRINFQYSPEPIQAGVYWWINAYSVELEAVRFDLGLPVVGGKFNYPLPEGYRRRFHITIGNTKDVPPLSTVHRRSMGSGVPPYYVEGVYGRDQENL